MRLPLCSCLGFLLLLSACFAPEVYSVEELMTNHHNQLGLPVTPDLPEEGFRTIFETYQDRSLAELEDYLSTQPLELNEASFGLYYLANASAGADDLDRALALHLAAANHYLNPQSYLKLAEREFFATKDYAQAYYYLHHALELLVEATGNNRSHPLSKNTKDKAQYLLQELEHLGSNGYFDKEAVRNQLKKELPPLMETYRALYQLPPAEPS